MFSIVNLEIPYIVFLQKSEERETSMHPVSFITRILIVTVALTLSSYVAAERPGGKTIGGGFEGPTKLKRGDSWPVFTTHKTKGIPACITVSPKNDGDLELTILDDAASGGPGLVSISIPSKGLIRTDCFQGLVTARIQCIGGNCEFHWRVDQLGPLPGSTPDDPDKPGDTIPAPN